MEDDYSYKGTIALLTYHKFRKIINLTEPGSKKARRISIWMYRQICKKNLQDFSNWFVFVQERIEHEMTMKED